MTGLIWSFVLSGIGIVGIILAGSKYKLGWLIGFGVQPLWIVFAITTGQYGFILNACIYAAVYARNWLKWRREDRRPWAPFSSQREHRAFNLWAAEGWGNMSIKDRFVWSRRAQDELDAEQEARS